MRFQLRLATWTVTGALQQLVLFGIGALSTAALAALVLVVIGSLAIRGLLPGVDRDLDQRWAEELAPLSTLPDRYPPVSMNLGARRLEQLGADLGITLPPTEYAHRPRPTREAAAELEAVTDLLVDRDTLDDWTLDPSYGDWRSRHQATISEIVEVSLNDPSPRWEMDELRFPGGPVTNPAGQILLQRVLATEAWIDAANGGTSVARTFDAMWRLSGQLFESPQPAAHTTGLTILQLQLGLLRRLPRAPDGWRQRLGELDPMRSALVGFLYDTWQVRRRAGTVFENRHPFLGFVAQPFARALAVPHHDTMLFAVSELQRRELTTFDPDEFSAELHARIPRWNTYARNSLPASWWAWPHGVREALEIELTSRVLELRERLSVAGPSAVDGIEPRQPGRLQGLSWHYELSGPIVRISLHPDVFADEQSPAMEAAVAIDERTQEDVRRSGAR